jgi:hypothetical protein
MHRALLILLLSIACAAAAAAAEPPVLDAAAVPYVKPEGRASYRNFLLVNLPRAFAVASSGAYGWQGGTGTLQEMRAKALASCAAKGGSDCAIYAEDLTVAFPGRPRIEPPAVPGPLITGSGYAFVPDERFIWYGPQTARGLFVWGHGIGGPDESHVQPQNYVRAFNNAGFDVVRFARDSTFDSERNASEWLQDDLPKLRAMGWHLIVAGGQSAGGWASLATVDKPGLADAVIAVSAAYLNTALMGAQAAGLYALSHSANAPNTRVAIVYFQGDPYVTEGIDNRLSSLLGGLKGHVGPILVIDRPPGFSGHGGARAYDFGRRYGPCLLRFVLDTPPPTSCDGATQ